jgi:hypothetical protein
MILNKSCALFHQGIRRICMSSQRSQSNTIILKSRSHVPLRRGDMQGKTPNLFCIFSWVALCWTPLCIFIWHSEIADKKGASVRDEEFYWLIDNSASFPCIYIQTICSGSGLRRICMSRQRLQSNTIVLNFPSHAPLQSRGMQVKTPNLFTYLFFISLYLTVLCIFIRILKFHCKINN